MKTLPGVFRRNLIPPAVNAMRDFDRFFNDLSNTMDWESDRISPLVTSHVPACDMHETDSHYLMTFDLPGVKREEIKVDITDNRLRVSGERKEELEMAEHNGGRHERFYGRFERTFILPASIKSEQIEAQYMDGVLRVAVPKVEAAKLQTVKIYRRKTRAMG